MKTLKKLFLLLILVSLTQSALNQDIVKTKQVVENYTNPFPYRGVYHVLKSDKSIRHGMYRKESQFGKLLCTGLYKMGKQAGFWAFYGWGNNQIDYQINFDEGGKLILSDNKINQKVPIVNALNIEVEETVDQIAICKNGYAELLATMSPNLLYPAEARENRIEGVVMVKYYVNELGKMELIGIHKSVHPILDKEALRIFNLIADQFEWYPAIKDGKLVKMKLFHPLTFKLS